jgi:hypothetical protein
LLLLSSVFSQLLLAHLRPYSDAQLFYISFFNELAASLYLYLMLFLAELNMQDNWEDDEMSLDLREKLGWALLGLVMITVAINLVRAVL